MSMMTFLKFTKQIKTLVESPSQLLDYNLWQDKIAYFLSFSKLLEGVSS